MVGERLSKITKFVDETEEFVIYDEKTGKPTNRKKMEKKGRIVFAGNIPDIEVKWVEKKYGHGNWSGIYRDDLEDRFEGLDVECIPDRELLEGIIIGRKILDGGFDCSVVDTDITTLQEANAEVVQAFAKLGFEIEPDGVYMIHYYS